MKTNVFVYGTLKEGFGNHRLLAGARRMGQACTVDNWLLYDGGFPCMASPSQFEGKTRDRVMAFAGQVYGEVYAVDDDTLAALDRLEGTPHLYTREAFQVQFAPGKVIDVQGYQFVRPHRLSVADLLTPNENNVLTWPVNGGRHRRFA